MAEEKPLDSVQQKKRAQFGDSMLFGILLSFCGEAESRTHCRVGSLEETYYICKLIMPFNLLRDNFAF